MREFSASFVLFALACQPDDFGYSYRDAPLASGAAIQNVSFYQGPARTLFRGADAGPSGVANAPIVAERDGLLRVAVTLDPDEERRPIAVSATIRNRFGEDTFDDVLVADHIWDVADLTSTFNVEIPADAVRASTHIDVSVHEVQSRAAVGDVSRATWSTADEGFPVSPPRDVNIVVFPIRYNADGSGRVPENLPGQLARIQQRFEALYPVSSVHLSEGETLNWDRAIDPFGNGWTPLLATMSELRSDAVEPPNTFYYALFATTDTVQEFCARGCILGLSVFGEEPSDDWAKASMGIGYDTEDSAYVAVHEVGHAHGLEHAPCGGADGPDPDFPYAGGGIGSWGYDLIDEVLVDPRTHADVMGYCDPSWISDHNYRLLYGRLAAFDQRNAALRAEWSRWILDDVGEGFASKRVSFRGNPGREEVFVELRAGDGSRVGTATGWFTRLTHLPGGFLHLHPDDVPEATQSVHVIQDAG